MQKFKKQTYFQFVQGKKKKKIKNENKEEVKNAYTKKIQKQNELLINSYIRTKFTTSMTG